MADTGNRPNDSAISGDEPPKNSCVTGEWQVSLVLSDEWAVPLPARFTYRADDPYAVCLDFYLTMAHPVCWTFARGLLISGSLRSSGLGDVRTWPTYDDMVCLRLGSRDGDALLEIPGAPLTEWLERTYQLVSPGREYEHQPLDPDALLRSLTDEAGTDGSAPAQPTASGHANEERLDAARRRKDTVDGPPEDGPGDLR